MTSIKKLKGKEEEDYFNKLKEKYESESLAKFGSARNWDDGIIGMTQSRDILGLSLMIC